MELKSHQNGPCTVSYGSIYGITGTTIEDPAVIVDMSDDDDDAILTLIKYGSKKMIDDVYNKMHETYVKAGFHEMADNLTVLSFTVISGFPDYDKIFNARFTSDEICTLINWMNNCIPMKHFKTFLGMNETEMHDHLKHLEEIGF